ncbi:conjugal transfer ATPase VirC1 [uncultured Roseibium sp.]|uniref:conjugal transfer ATPase VirC1 n=1 Tax=uncultured Roseibium sp. TaxID=1936171 RepID=UPI00261AC46F|nr:conjugal transfer ATPase VirC1 [uncultured Roseibium sp.]
MKLISFCSLKGGAGKTTSLMAICSSLAARGASIALFEADDNRPLIKWKQNSFAWETWDDLCEVFVADEMDVLETAYREAVSESYDYGLVDTHGGVSELNNTIIASSDFIVLPCALTALDIDETLATYKYIVELLISEQLEIPSAILRQRVPVRRLTKAQHAAQDMLQNLPLFTDPMFDRDAFASMKERGMLHKNVERLSEDAFSRLQLRNFETAMNEANRLSAEILDILRVS